MDVVVHATCAVLAIAVVLCATEDLSLDSTLFRDNLFDWRYCLAFQPKLKPAHAGPFAHAAFGVTTFRLTAILRLGGMLATLALVVAGSPYAVVSLLFVLSAYFYLFYRLPYALDGADQMTLFVLIGLLIMLLDGGTGEFVRLGAAAITLHAALSYVTSGLAKLGSPIWRSGVGFRGIMNSGEFGSPWFAAAIERYPKLSFVISWTIMLTHLAVAVAILAGGQFVLLALAASALFHVSVALTMRLNNFVWAFGAAYPGILFLASWDERALLANDLLGI